MHLTKIRWAILGGAVLLGLGLGAAPAAAEPVRGSGVAVAVDPTAGELILDGGPVLLVTETTVLVGEQGERVELGDLHVQEGVHEVPLRYEGERVQGGVRASSIELGAGPD